MQGHAGANLMPVVAANRMGREVGAGSEREITFYGTSFVTDGTGAVLAEAGRTEEAVVVAEFDLDQLRRDRMAWGLFRDRRPEMYGPIRTVDGTTEPAGR